MSAEEKVYFRGVGTEVTSHHITGMNWSNGKQSEVFTLISGVTDVICEENNKNRNILLDYLMPKVGTVRVAIISNGNRLVVYESPLLKRRYDVPVLTEASADAWWNSHYAIYELAGYDSSKRIKAAIDDNYREQLWNEIINKSHSIRYIRVPNAAEFFLAESQVIMRAIRNAISEHR